MSVIISEEFNPQIPLILAHDKIFQIQVGTKIYRLSGASLSSDAPSHFTNFFSVPVNQDKILFIDRSPDIFDLIYQHLQGYQISVDNDSQFIQIYSDSYYFSLRRLQKFLAEEDVFANVGNESFKISRSLFTQTGNFPNYFTISLSSLLTDNIESIKSKNMIRPPPQRSVTVPNRSPKLFRDLLELLRKNYLVIENEEHRNSLLRECKYYRFLELEQQTIKHKILNNPFGTDNKQEIVIGLKDLSPKGFFNESPPDGSREVALQYCRPYIANEPKRTLIFQIDSGCDTYIKDYSEVKLIVNKAVGISVVNITNKLSNRMIQLFKGICEPFEVKTNAETGSQEISVLVGLKDCKSTVNGLAMKTNWIYGLLNESKGAENDEEVTTKKRKSEQPHGDILEIRLTKSLWKMMFRGKKLRLHCISFEGLTDESAFIKQEIDFL
ncbi:BTB/POZ domain-containing protein [[Candida] railenensis]|uniref:BTB/POZ domain-containing protein n=1 Tax=[Candida] railenensis TaxID=45579 RepID=A0A9P0QQS3_9ASCO|nr:BTB/POZ domain-containing protein [[Candida] railenensis]